MELGSSFPSLPTPSLPPAELLRERLGERNGKQQKDVYAAW